MLHAAKNLRGLDTIVYYRILVRLQIRVRVRVLQFVAGHLPFEPHSDSVIQLQSRSYGRVISWLFHLTYDR